MKLITREEWGALPATGSSGPWASGWGDFLVVHYTGISARPDPTDFEAKADYLRGLQAYYQSGKHPNGPLRPDGTYAPFVDVGYNFACWNDDEPAIWELRGFRMRGGANGTAASNAIRPSCLIVADVGEEVHPAVAGKMAWLVDQVRQQSGKATGTRGHRDEFNTGCPGELIYPLVTSGAFLLENQPAPPVVDPAPDPSEGFVYKLATVKLPDGTIAAARFRVTLDTSGTPRELVWLEDDNRVARCGGLPEMELDMNQVFLCSVDQVPVGDTVFAAFAGRDWARWDFLASPKA